MSTWPNRGASGGPCGGLKERTTEQPKPSDHAGLTQANRPPRNPVRFKKAIGYGVEDAMSELLVEYGNYDGPRDSRSASGRIATCPEYEGQLTVQRGPSKG